MKNLYILIFLVSLSFTHNTSIASQIQPLEPLVDYVDMMEINYFYDDQSRFVFNQVIFRDWDREASRYQVVDWRLIKSESQINYQKANGGGFYVEWSDFKQRNALRRVNIKIEPFKTYTQQDPELIEREFLPQDKRRELKKPGLKPLILHSSFDKNPLVDDSDVNAAANPTTPSPSSEEFQAEDEKHQDEETFPKAKLSLFYKSGGERIGVTQGKIVLKKRLSYQTRIFSSRYKSKGLPVEEKFTLAGSYPSLVTYSYRSPHCFLEMKYSETGAFDLVWNRTTRLGLTRTVHFSQKFLDKDIVLMVDGDTYTASSIWHLILLHPKVFKENLEPALYQISPDFQLSQFASELRSQLTASSRKMVESEGPSFLSLVRQRIRRFIYWLDSDNAEKRREGLLSLHRLSAAEKAFLNSLFNEKQFRSGLSKNQTVGIRGVIENIYLLDSDRAESVSESMMFDTKLWLAFSESEDEHTRQLAEEHLSLWSDADIRRARGL